jgi:thiosulfate/3-mercaptopyruvate sulfurtransferase
MASSRADWPAAAGKNRLKEGDPMPRWWTLALVLLALAVPRAVPAQAADGNPHLLVTADWLATQIHDGAPVVVLHVGTDREAYAGNHIPGARFLALQEIVVTGDGNLNQLPDASHLAEVFRRLGVGDQSGVVLYGDPLPAARAFFTLDYLGHGERIALLDGGLAAWRAAGHSVSNQPAEVEPAPFTPRAQPDRVVDAAWVHRHLGDDGITLIDARPTAQYDGTETGGVERPGHIPGAHNLFWQTMLRSPELPLLRDAGELHELFASAGAAPGRTVVVYCRTGVQASMLYFVARYLGYEVKMYDGSFQDWSRRAELPVAR